MKKKNNNMPRLPAFSITVPVLILICIGITAFKQEPRPITLKEYNNLVSNKDTLVLAYFHASWCVVCAKMKPVLDDIEAAYPSKLKVLKIDTDRDKEITQEFEIDALPVLMLYKKNVRLWIHAGIITEPTLRAKIEAAAK